MDSLISDAVSIFIQILQGVAPEHAGDFEFLLTAYIFSGIFVLMTIWLIYKIVSSFAYSVIKLLSIGR